jgi:hypothetical protein
MAPVPTFPGDASIVPAAEPWLTRPNVGGGGNALSGCQLWPH